MKKENEATCRIVPGKDNAVGAARKPNSVPGPGYPWPSSGHSSGGTGCPDPYATYPGTRAGHPLVFPYLVLHRVGFAELPRSPGELVRSYRTVSPLPRPRARRCPFCCTFLRVAATPRYGAPCPSMFGLSSGSLKGPATACAASTASFQISPSAPKTLLR